MSEGLGGFPILAVLILDDVLDWWGGRVDEGRCGFPILTVRILREVLGCSVRFLSSGVATVEVGSLCV